MKLAILSLPTGYQPLQTLHSILQGRFLSQKFGEKGFPRCPQLERSRFGLIPIRTDRTALPLIPKTISIHTTSQAEQSIKLLQMAAYPCSLKIIQNCNVILNL